MLYSPNQAPSIVYRSIGSALKCFSRAGVRGPIAIIVFSLLPSKQADGELLEDVLSANQINANAIKSASIEYTYTSEMPGVALSDPAALSPTTKKLWDLNRNISLQGRFFWDANERVWTIRETDDRNPGEVATALIVPLESARDLSKSRSMLARDGVRVLLRNGQCWIDDLSQDDPGRRNWKPHVYLLDGIVPLEYLENPSRICISETTWHTRQVIRLSIQRSPASSVVVYCDPDVQYRYLANQVVSNGRVVAEEVAADYRLVDGIHYPFDVQKASWDENGTLLQRVRLLVTKAEFNRQIDHKDFQLCIPAEATVSDSIARLLVRSPREVCIDMNEALQLSMDIKSGRISASP